MTEASKVAFAEWESKLSFDLLLGLLIRNGSITPSDATQLCTDMLGYVVEVGSKKPEFSAAAQPAVKYWERLAARYQCDPHPNAVQ